MGFWSWISTPTTGLASHLGLEVEKGQAVLAADGNGAGTGASIRRGCPKGHLAHLAGGLLDGIWTVTAIQETSLS